MAQRYAGKDIDPKVAGHLVAAMDEVPGPQPVLHSPPPAPGGQQWPDSSSKHRHVRERDTGSGRPGHEAAVNAVHRTGRPEMPHSS